MEGGDYLEQEVPLGGNMFGILNVLLLSQEYTSLKTYLVVHFKCMQIICQS